MYFHPTTINDDIFVRMRDELKNPLTLDTCMHLSLQIIPENNNSRMASVNQYNTNMRSHAGADAGIMDVSEDKNCLEAHLKDFVKVWIQNKSVS